MGTVNRLLHDEAGAQLFACILDVEAVGMYFCLRNVFQDELSEVAVFHLPWYFYLRLAHKGQQ